VQFGLKKFTAGGYENAAIAFALLPVFATLGIYKAVQLANLRALCKSFLVCDVTGWFPIHGVGSRS